MAGSGFTIETGKHAALIAAPESTVELLEQGEGTKRVELRNIGKCTLNESKPAPVRKRIAELSVLRMNNNVTGVQRTRAHRPGFDSDRELIKNDLVPGLLKMRKLMSPVTKTRARMMHIRYIPRNASRGKSKRD
jgi:hypothetical protein